MVVESLGYRVIKEDGNIERHEYDDYIVANTRGGFTDYSLTFVGQIKRDER